jgi:hypothetical protein
MCAILDELAVKPIVKETIDLYGVMLTAHPFQRWNTSFCAAFHTIILSKNDICVGPRT